MSDLFDNDPYPGRPKILFIGWPESSHTHSWIDLLEGEKFNVRLFCLASSAPPADWPVKSYITCQQGERYHSETRLSVLPAPNDTLSRPALAENYSRRGVTFGRIGRILTRATGRAPSDPVSVAPQPQPATFEEALAKVIREWQPDVVHTLGFDPASYAYSRTRRQYGLQDIGRWVAQARGGPDLALHRYSPDHRPQIQEILKNCDHFIADNQQNYDYALGAGLTSEKISEPGMGVVSGPGGIDVDAFKARWTLPPSQRERIIVWPKAYETCTAKAMPVFAAILKVWEKIQPCRIEMLWMTQPEVRIWYEKLFPEEIKKFCPAHPRLTREETLAHISKARVLLAPSLSDGIPNAMMEAMALGAVPLVSPLDTITPVVKNEENVLFADNLYPDEIAQALVRLMTDDDLADRMAANNLTRVRELADRTRVRRDAVAYYETIARMAANGRSFSADCS